MPVNGLVFAADQIQIGIGQSDIPATPGTSILCENQSLYTPDAVNVAVGIDIYLQGTGSDWKAVYRGPNEPFGGYIVSGLTGTSGTIDVYLNDYKLYANLYAEWRAVCSSIDIYVNGSLSTTLAGFDLTSSALGPSWVPIFAGFCSITGGGTTTGGWRWYADSAWHDLPISVPTVADAPTSGIGTDGSFHPIPVDAPFDLAASDAIVSTSTWGTQIYAFPEPIPSGGPDYDVQGASGSIILIPDLPKSLNRMVSGSGADLYRFAVPQCYGSSTRGIERTAPGSFKLATFTNTTDVVSRSAPVGEEVADSPGTVEAFLALPTYSIITAWRNRTRESGGGTIFDVETLTTQYPVHVDTSSDASIASYMDHADINARYFNSAVCHPHWSLFYTPGGWDVDGSPESEEDYWGPVRQQHLITSTKRNHNASCPLEASGFTTWLDTYVGPGFRWAGISRWQTKEVTPLADYTYDSGSSALWTADDGVLVAGTDIVVTPTVAFAGDVAVDLELASFTVAPFLWPEITNKITPDWDGSNISACSVYIVGRSGETVLVSTDDPGTEKDWPLGTPSKYSGSYVNDFSYGPVTDQGSDVDAGGMSATVYSDPAMVFAAMGLSDRTGAKLRYVITPTVAALPVTLHYPRLRYTIGATRKQVQETACAQIVVHPDGPGVRFGQWTFYPGALTNPPLVSSGIGKSTILDFLCTSRLTLEGLAYDDGLTTELAARYDSYEGNSAGQVDGSSVAFLLPETGGDSKFRIGLVNTMGEVPPLASFPQGARSTTDWSKGASAQEAWMMAQAGDKVVAPKQVDVYTSGAVLASTSAALVSGWVETSFAPALTEAETGWKISRGSKALGDFRPWHGAFVLPVESGGLPLAYDVSDGVRHVRVLSDGSGGILTGWAPNAPLPLSWSDSAISNSWDWADIRYDRRSPSQRLVAAVEESGTVKIYTSPDGLTFTLATTVGTGKTPALHYSPDRRLYLTYSNGGDLMLEAFDPQDNSLFAVTAVSGGVDDSGSAVYTLGLAGGRFLALLAVEGGSVTRRVSQDGGETWGSPAAIGSGKYPRAVSGPPLRLLEAWLDGTDIKGRRLDLQSNVLDAASVWASGADDSSFGLQESAGAGGQWRAVLLFAQGGSDAQLSSPDGVVWS